MKGFHKIKLGDVLTFQRGFDITKSAQSDGDVPIVSSSGVSSYHNKWKAKGPGVIIGRKGTLGTVHFIRSHYWPHDTTLWVKDFKGNDPRFLSYYLQTLKLENFDVGASNPTLNRNHVHKLRIIFPKKVQIQKRIGAILSAYDDLIETNKRCISLLETVTEEIYREWFVRLRFPGHDQIKVEKGVPSGWSFDTASEFFGLVKGKSYAGDEITDDPEHMPFISLKSFNRGGGYREDGLKFYSGRYKNQQVVHQNDVVVAVTDMTQDRAVVGRAARIPNLGEKGAVISLDAVKLVPHNIDATFMYAYMRHSGFSDFIKEFANGTNVLHLKPDLITKQKIIIAPRDLQDRFALKVNPLYAKVDCLGEANRLLAILRDRLLSLILSGKLSVENLDIQFPPNMAENVNAVPSDTADA
jgi:type I restriction enzyme S subunit